MLTKRQRDLVHFIDRYQREHEGIAPSFAEMTAALSVKSKSVAHRLLRGAEERGALRLLRNDGGRVRARSVEVVKQDAHAAEVLPGTLQSAGKPIIKYRGHWFRFDTEDKELKPLERRP